MTTSEFERVSLAVQAVEPRARLVSRRLLRRAIRRHLHLSAGAKAPHNFVFELPSSLAEAITGDRTIDTASPNAILLALPDDAESSMEQALRDSWRKLFHAALDRTIDQKGGSFADRRDWFGPTMLYEIRSVLTADHRLIPAADERIEFREFTALYLELQFFEPKSLHDFFPGLLNPHEVSRYLDERYGARALFDATRPTGAADVEAHVEHNASHPTENNARKATLSPADIERTRGSAAIAAHKGNDVRAAVRYGQIREAALADDRLRSLVDRLRKALLLDDAAASAWLIALRPILNIAAIQGFWDAGERLLYDLQKACLDVERKTYSTDVVEWIVSFGWQPVKRLLEKPRLVNVLRRLRAACKHLRSLPFAAHELDHLLHDAIHSVERRVRAENGPILNEVLDEVGIVPQNQAERISRHKMVEELLDTLCARGFIKMSDLRDAIARNRVKLDDLSGPVEFFTGDPLIRANRKLAIRMDGIYRRGEIYMRGLQRISSIGFGTKIGRLLVLWLLLPFVASFVILTGVHEIAHLGGKAVQFLEKILVGTAAEQQRGHGEHWMNPWLERAIFAVFLLVMIHAPSFRRQVFRWARIALIDVPSRLYHSPILRAVFNNAATRFFARYMLLPLIVGSAAILILRWLRADWDETLLVSGGLSLLTATLFRTPYGRALEERLDEALAQLWRVLSVNFILGALTLVLHFFRWIFEWMERGMYAVDESLRFKEGQSTLMLAFKTVFGLFWFIFTYLFRFAWNLLIEPQINPIKHFPVVTASHKVILPMSLTGDFQHEASPLAEIFMGPLDLSVKSANTVASTVVWGIPGIFGFLAWELKENWKLYKANNSPVIDAIPVGSHGERVRGLLRPGFHSGAIPKTFAKLRRALAAGNPKKAAKHHHHLEHVAEAVERLTERELIAYLKSSRRWGGLPIHVEKIVLATNRIRIFLTIHHWQGAVIISIEERGGWLIGSLEDAGWTGRLTDKQRAAFIDALTELYKLSGVHLVREQAADRLKIDKRSIDCRSEGLLVYPVAGGSPATIDYTDAPNMVASAPIGGRGIPELAKIELVLTECPVRWEKWVERWEQDHAGKAPLEPLLGRYRIV